jgi:hypothetical protein
MQKLIRINSPSTWEMEDISNKYLSTGWNVKNMVVMGENKNTLIILLEKESRKEKLEHLNDISKS